MRIAELSRKNIILTDIHESWEKRHTTKVMRQAYLKMNPHLTKNTMEEMQAKFGISEEAVKNMYKYERHKINKGETSN